MNGNLIDITLNEADLPVLKFTVTAEEKYLEQKLLGALIRAIARHGVELHLVKTFPTAENEEKLNYEYEIRAKQSDETDH